MISQQDHLLEFFLNGAELSLNLVISANSGNFINHWNMNWAQFKDPASHICLTGSVVASWSLTQKVAGSSPLNFKYFLSLNLPNSVKSSTGRFLFLHLQLKIFSVSNINDYLSMSSVIIFYYIIAIFFDSLDAGHLLNMNSPPFTILISLLGIGIEIGYSYK